MRLAIADPPYLGRAARWYGVDGAGDSSGVVRADEHPDAAVWDDPATHHQLVDFLETEYDGWVIALSVHSLSTYLGIIPTDSRNGIRVCVWHRPNSVNSPSVRVLNRWEPVIARIPDARRGRAELMHVPDVLTAPVIPQGFIGAKPPAWTRWALDLMGYDPVVDTVDDLFPGSGAVSREIAQGILL